MYTTYPVPMPDLCPDARVMPCFDRKDAERQQIRFARINPGRVAYLAENSGDPLFPFIVTDNLLYFNFHLPDGERISVLTIYRQPQKRVYEFITNDSFFSV